jgi:ParB-like chromosome segregation protein Spo0J
VLARVLDLDDEGMLALQYRENALRKDVSVLERGRWLRQLAEQRGLSTTRVAALVGLSQPMVVEYQNLARLPEVLLDGLADPRELSLADGRRLRTALARDGALERMTTVLKAAPKALGTKAQVHRALQAAALPSNGVGARAGTGSGSTQARVIKDDRGRRVGVLTRSGAQWICRFASDVDEEAVRHVADQIPILLASWRERR